MSLAVLENFSPEDLLHRYILERFGKSGSLSYSDLRLIQGWLELTRGDVDTLLMILEDFSFEGLNRLSLRAVSKSVTKRIHDHLSLMEQG